ncbi:MAG: cupin domain-containing protein [Ruminococcaceae bacterium]|nr:cupin domain-containing protein [Oscillospiraceae bacterium]
MELVKKLTTDFEYEDERGLICQICHGDFAQVNYVFSKAGAVRGRFHYHKKAQEQFYVISGKLKLEVYLGDRKEDCIFQTGDVFLIPAQVRHNFIYLEDTHLVSTYDICVETAENVKDIFND